ncbi:M14 family metallopeptidase [Novosphingobium album (ex Liu et al. 2023)]|uniref:M14 family metallopeptidase n=1 Tax=Novosphingobium album (ex Liu et al. 2023) TaxID=3031130 RepID=A0ABT5WQJ1_9SPHN|nr:M14 family metallopeptidase [Novosphingobium album (ex Liu et al. 2023)]MDE8652031.1 M14 family metallopeptidase [Novosphingobium album (ex Liu et al. 2023)]
MQFLKPAAALALRASALALTVAGATAPMLAVAQSALPTPESWFGHRMGTDRKLEPYDKIVAYYRALEAGSDRIKIVELGKSTEGRPFLAMFVSSPENLARLEEYRRMNLKLADPRGVPQDELDRIVRDGKAIIVQSYDLHSSEIGSSLTSVEFTHSMLTRTDADMQRVLDNVITIIMPSLNPDGHDMVQDWYMKYVGTPYEGGQMPWLYQKYVGHDNNRDAFMQNMVESRYIGGVLFRDWIPEAYIDHHQMGQYGPRISLPPYTDPIRPSGDPLVWREMTWYGAAMAYKLDEANLAGGIGDAIYSGWGHFGFHWITPFHNITGMLDESAGANIATPLYVHPEQLKGGQRNVPDNKPQMNMPNPWPGGWWRSRDIVDRQLVTSWALVDTAARNKEEVLRNMYLKAQRQTQRGAEGPVKAYVVDVKQHDPLTAGKMINALLLQGVNVYKAPGEFVHEGRVYGAGSYVVPMNQPKMGVVRWLLGQTNFPDDIYARTKDGTPIRPYDMSTDTMTEFMGVESTPVSTTITAGLEPLTAAVAPQGTVDGAGPWLLSGALNDSYRAVNLALKGGGTVQRVTAPAGGAQAGDFVVTGLAPSAAQGIASTTGVSFAAASGVNGSIAVKAPRIAMLKRYRGGNIDEGWTRFVLESFDYSYKSIMDAEIKSGNLIRKYDVIVLPEDSISAMTGEKAGGDSGGFESMEAVPPEYISGFGEEGVKALNAFVKAGGKLVTFGRAGELPIEKFGLPVVNVLKGKSSKEFWSPGSTLKVKVDTSSPLAFGMPEEALAIFTAGNQAYDVTPRMHNDNVRVIASYVDKDVLRSGWLLGEEVIAGKAAMVSIKHGQGNVILIGFRPQHRSQAHGTYKLLFDSLIAPVS